MLGEIMGAGMDAHVIEQCVGAFGNRRFFGKELLWEIPVAVGMALIGEAAARYIGLSQPVSTGFVATLAYLGPRGAEALLTTWIGRRKP